MTMREEMEGLLVRGLAELRAKQAALDAQQAELDAEQARIEGHFDLLDKDNGVAASRPARRSKRITDEQWSSLVEESVALVRQRGPVTRTELRNAVMLAGAPLTRNTVEGLGERLVQDTRVRAYKRPTGRGSSAEWVYEPTDVRAPGWPPPRTETPVD